MDSSSENTKTPIQRVIDILAEKRGRWGVQAYLARKLGVRPSYVHKMVTTGVVPPEQCRKIQAIVEDQVTAEELCPDIFEKVSPEKLPAA